MKLTKKKDTKIGFIQRHKNNLISKYIEKGYTQKDAERLASNRMKTEAIVAVAATVAVSAIGISVAKKIGAEYCDKTFKSGKIIQNIGDNINADFNKGGFYAAINKHDKKAYRMLFPKNKLLMGSDGNSIYNNQIKLNKDIKQASISNARKVLYDKMESDSGFKTKVLNTIYGESNSDLAKAMYKNRPKDFYNAFNVALAQPKFKNSNISEDFYSALNKKGYNAILDLNDTRYSGFKGIAKAPTIFFGQGQNIYDKVKNDKISASTIDDTYNKYFKQYIVKEYSKRVGVIIGANVAKKKLTNQQIVKKYLKEHPNSELSDNEIVKAYRKEQKVAH